MGEPASPAFGAEGQLCGAILCSARALGTRRRLGSRISVPRTRARRPAMEPKNRVELKGLEAVAGNGLLDRRAFLRGGAAFAAAATGYTVARSAGAAPLADDPWSLLPGAISPPYEQRLRLQAKVARTLSNPKGETRTSHARTPH